MACCTPAARPWCSTARADRTGLGLGHRGFEKAGFGPPFPCASASQERALPAMLLPCRAELARLLLVENQKQPGKLGSTPRRMSPWGTQAPSPALGYSGIFSPPPLTEVSACNVPSAPARWNASPTWTGRRSRGIRGRVGLGPPLPSRELLRCRLVERWAEAHPTPLDRLHDPCIPN